MKVEREGIGLFMGRFIIYIRDFLEAIFGLLLKKEKIGGTHIKGHLSLLALVFFL